MALASKDLSTMAAKEIVVRLVTPGGRSRITLPSTATFAELQEKVNSSSGVATSAQRLALDPKGQQLVNGAPTALITQLGIANGTQLHLLNNDASIAAQVLTKVPVTVEPEKPVPGAAASSSSAVGGSASSSGAGPADSMGRSLDSKPDPNKKVEAKFEAFDSFLRKRQWDTAALPGAQVFKSAQIQKGGMMKVPLSVSVKQQPYRHVDTLSIMNVPEMEDFIGYWHTTLDWKTQRGGWLYGYYIEDKNYDEGIRAVVEAVYEPPQEQVGEAVQFLPDPLRHDDCNIEPKGCVDRIAERLGLERVGWIFTAMPNTQDLLLSPQEVHRIARYQHMNSTDVHFTKYRLSKFCTFSVRPDSQGNPDITPFMVADQVCAMVRDNILIEDADPANLVGRQPNKGEMIPDFLVEGKTAKAVSPDFFVVRLNDTVPRKIRSMFKHATFPRESRHPPQRRDDIKNYFKRREKSEPSWSRFADFHLILYLSQVIDIDTALLICDAVRERQEIPEGVLEIINGFCV